MATIGQERRFGEAAAGTVVVGGAGARWPTRFSGVPGLLPPLLPPP